MASIIDALVVTLGLDASNFKKGQQETEKGLHDTKRKADDTAQAIDQSQKKAGKSFSATGKQAKETADVIETGTKRTNNSLRSVDVQTSSLTKSFSAMGEAGAAPFAAIALGVGAAVVAVKGFQDILGAAIETASSGAALGRAAGMAGIDVTQFAAWGNAIASFGGNAQAAQGSLASLAQQQAMMRLTGQPSKALQTLEAFGINPTSSPIEIMKSLAGNQRLQQMDPAEKTAVLGGILGLDPDTISAIEKGPGFVNKLLATQATKGNVSPEQVKTMTAFNTAVGNLNQAFSQLATNLEVDIMPALTEMAQVLTGWINWLDNKFPKWFHDNVKSINNGVKSVTNEPFTYTANQQAAIDAGMKDLGALGLSKSEAAGVLGSVQRESKFNPGAHVIDTDGQLHVGLFQWSPERRAAILKATGIDVANASAADQYKAALWEVNNLPQYAGLKRAFARNPNMSPQEAAKLWVDYFERPKNAQAEALARGQIAANIYNGALDPRKQPSAGVLSAHHPVVAALKAAQGAQRAVGIVPGGWNGKRPETHIENHITVHAPSGSAHDIAKAVVNKLAQHQGSVAQIGGSLS